MKKNKDKTVTYELTINISHLIEWLLFLGVIGLYCVMFYLLFIYHGII